MSSRPGFGWEGGEKLGSGAGQTIPVGSIQNGIKAIGEMKMVVVLLVGGMAGGMLNPVKDNSHSYVKWNTQH